MLPQSSHPVRIAAGDPDGKAPSGCPAEIKRRAEIAGEILQLPADAGGETLLQLFCRLQNLPPPRRTRAVFDVLVRNGRARNFPHAVTAVVDWLRDTPGVEINL